MVFSSKVRAMRSAFLMLAGLWLALAGGSLAYAQAVPASDLTIVDYRPMSKVPVAGSSAAKPLYDYTYAVEVRNAGAAVADLSAIAASRHATVQLVLPEVRFGAVAASRNQMARDFLKVRASCWFDLRLDPKDANGKTRACKVATVPVEDDEADGYGFGLAAAAVSAHYSDKLGRALEWRLLVRAAATAPKIIAMTPSGLLKLATPAIGAQLQDGGGGINAAAARLLLDSVDVTAQATSAAGAVSYQPPTPLPDGVHQVSLAVPDKAGNMARIDWSFTIDATGPVVANPTPAADTFLDGGSTPVISASWSDGVSGVDPARTTLSLDGVDVTRQAAVTADGIALRLQVPLADGTHSIIVSVADRAGNMTTSTWSFGVASAPVVTAVAPQDVVLPAGSMPMISAQYEDKRQGIDTAAVLLLVDGIDVTAQSRVTATGVSFTPPQPLAEGPHSVVVVVVNKANASAQQAWGFDVEAARSASLAIVSPAPGAITPEPTINVAAMASANGTHVVSLTVNGADMPAAGMADEQSVADRYAGDVALQPGANTLAVTATYADGQTRSATVDVVYDAPPTLVITSPQDRATLGAAGPTSPRDLTGNVERPVTITGTTSKPVASVTINQQQAIVDGTSFRFEKFFLHEGTNAIAAVATDARGRTAVAAITVSVDQTAPFLAIETPASNSTTSANTIDIRGTVNDAVEGYYGAPEPKVVVKLANGSVNARVGDKNFLAMGVALALGSNTITVVATDQAGNERSTSINVMRVAAAGDRLASAGGNGQEVPAGAALPAPLAVSALDASGAPLANMTVQFAVLRGTGRIALSKEALSTSARTPQRQLAVRTDANGMASVWMVAGTQGGPGGNAVRASASGLAEEVTFIATSVKGQARHIRADMGINQFVATGAQPLEALTAVLLDDHENRVADAPVTFSVQSGDVAFAGADGKPVTSVTVTTDKNGFAAVRPTMGARPGIAVVTALPANNSVDAIEATFTLQALKPTDGATSFVGTVTNDKGQPLPGATVSIGRTALSTTVDDRGQFRFDDIPPGKIDLFVDGRTVNLQGQQYPALHFETVAVKGVQNQLPHAAYLPALQMAEVKTVGGDKDVVLKMPGIEGYEMTVFAHSVTFPDGSKEGPLVVSPISFDKLPMTPPGGYAGFMAPAGTMQPSGTRFDPPVRLKVPNTAGFAPGEKRPVYQWDHDLGTFVQMGQATVTEDGAFLVTDLGTGISKAGWYPIPNPPPPDQCPQGGSTRCSECQKESKTASRCPRRYCEFDKSKDGMKIPPTIVVAGEREFEFGKSSMMKFLGKIGLPDTKIKAKYGVQGSADAMCCGKTQKKELLVSLPSIFGALEAEAEGGLTGYSIKNDFIKAGLFAKLKLVASGAISYRRDFCKEERGRLAGSLSGGIVAELAAKFDLPPPTSDKEGALKLNLLAVGAAGFVNVSWIPESHSTTSALTLTGFAKSEVTFGSRKYVLWNAQLKWDYFQTSDNSADTHMFDAMAAGTH